VTFGENTRSLILREYFIVALQLNQVLDQLRESLVPRWSLGRLGWTVLVETFGKYRRLRTCFFLREEALSLLILGGRTDSGLVYDYIRFLPIIVPQIHSLDLLTIRHVRLTLLPHHVIHHSVAVELHEFSHRSNISFLHCMLSVVFRTFI